MILARSGSEVIPLLQFLLTMQSLSPFWEWGRNMDINMGLLGPQRLNIGPRRVLIGFRMF